MDLRAAQEQYEIDSDTAAATEKLEQMRAEFLAGSSELPRAKAFIARAYSSVRDSLDAERSKQTRGQGGKVKGWLRKIPSEVAAVIALKTCIEIITRPGATDKPVTIQHLAIGIGKLYDTEVRIADAERVNPLYMQKIHEQVQENNTQSKQHLRKVYNVAHERVMKGEFESELCSSDLLHLGKYGVQACMDAGLVEVRKTYGQGGTVQAYSLAPEIYEFLSDYQEGDVANVFSRSSGAMMCPPDDWSTLNDGGYISTRRKYAQPLMGTQHIRRNQRKRNREMFTQKNMPLVFEAANYLQSVPFRMHAPTQDTINRVWAAKGGALGVPAKDRPTPPPCPMAPEWTKASGTDAEIAVFTEWKRSMREYFTYLKSWRSKVREITGFVKASGTHKGSMWFPVFFDTRGRWYYRGVPNPQGTDIAKATLHLDQKKPLGKRGVYWLKAMIANSFGYDKVRFDERVAWTDKNWKTIQRALDAPEDHGDVWGKDSPWCMYSAAYELNQALLSGSPETYETGIVVHMDATCSGLQHFSAMNRDPIGGRYVNLFDADFVGPKQDIYSHVATNAIRGAQLDSESLDKKTAAIAKWWLSTGIPRNMAKDPVMTYCYGATLRGTMDFVSDYVQGDMGIKFPDDYQGIEYSAYAAKKLFAGIAAAVPAAETTMNWLRSVASQMPNGKRMEWFSPTGFWVQQDYQDFDEVRIKLRSCGTTYVLLREYNDKTRSVPMRNAIAPNFVHSLDASHLTLTALSMKAKGLDMVGIHDSFGTHACDVDSMHESIRDTFVKMYTENNVLSSFIWDVGAVGEIPLQGSLDLELVKDSEFFFC